MESYYSHVQAHKHANPVLYISSVIISNRLHAPFLFKSLSRDLKRAQEEWGFVFKRCCCVAFNRKARFLVERYSFKPRGLCRGKFPVYMALRSESPIMDALLG
jgi:hypothetical protein